MNIISAINKTASELELARVKSGMDAGIDFPWAYVGWFFGALAILILLSLLFNHLRAKRHAGSLKGWASIAEPNRIAAVFKRAASRQADCTMEVFDQQRSDIYRCRVIEARPGSQVALELAQIPALDAAFEGFPIQVHMNFRPAPREDMEHYQFSAHTLHLSFHKEKTWRVARVAVSWPKIIISAQRRDFLRMEPLAEHAMNMSLHVLPDEVPQVMTSVTVQALEGAVLDISVGGMQILFPGVASIEEQKKYLVTIELPLNGLEVELKNNRLYLVFKPLSRDVLGLTSDAPDYRPGLGSRTVVRGAFIGRYRLRADDGQWDYVEFSPDSFQDMAHWIHAYQRYLLKKEKGLVSAPPERGNTFQSCPPKRFPKDSGDR